MDADLKDSLKVAGIAAAVSGFILAMVSLIKPDYRQKVVKIAKSQVGPQNPDKYWAVVAPSLMGNPTGIAWCGGFALWALRQAGLTNAMWPIGSGISQILPSTTNPQPGDVAYFNAPYQHHAIVDHIDGTTLYTIDGNQSPGEQVLPRTRQVKDATAFYSIQPLINAKG